MFANSQREDVVLYMGNNPTPPSDHTLQVQRLFVQHQRVVLFYVLSIEPNLGEAQDIVQETFLTVSRKAETYTIGSNFPAWACTIARYQALQFKRAQKQAAARIDDDVMEMLYGGEEPATEVLGKRYLALKSCLTQLAPKAADIIRRRYYLGEMPEDIATGIGWTPNAVRVALTRTRQSLRACINRAIATSQPT